MASWAWLAKARIVRWATVAAAVWVLLLAARPAAACKVLEFDFEPSQNPQYYADSALQIVIWIEDAQGNFVDTVYVTRSVGYYGIGNRPGEWNFPSNALFPYGRRETTLPVWAHRRGKTYPLIVFQDGYDQDLSHSIGQSSVEPYFCRPHTPSEVAAADSVSCATRNVFTDKGHFDSSGRMSVYPPRGDLTALSAGDSPDVEQYNTLDDLMGISRATPVGGAPVPAIMYPVPSTMPAGQYVAYIEVAKEGDFNSFYYVPKPENIAYANYGIDYIGQPSVVFATPFTLGPTADVEYADTYSGYGDPLAGGNGQIHLPDGTISTGVDGSGEGRLLEQQDPGTGAWYRFRVQSIDATGGQSPDPVGDLTATNVTGSTAEISFLAPGFAGATGIAASYDVRLKAGDPPIDPSDVVAFEKLPPLDGFPHPEQAGSAQFAELQNLNVSSHYSLGIRALGNCPDQVSPIKVVQFTTINPSYPAVDACFLATAAYGSLYAPQVTLLRRFRDQVLRPFAAGRLFIAAYYTLSPPLATTERALPPFKILIRQALLTPLGRFANRALTLAH
jgi:hypothetical protein